MHTEKCLTRIEKLKGMHFMHYISITFICYRFMFNHYVNLNWLVIFISDYKRVKLLAINLSEVTTVGGLTSDVRALVYMCKAALGYESGM